MRGLVQAVKAYEELAIAAAKAGDRDIALKALLANRWSPTGRSRRPPRRPAGGQSWPPAGVRFDRRGPLRGTVWRPRVRASLAYLTLFGGLGGLLPFASLYYLLAGSTTRRSVRC